MQKDLKTQNDDDFEKLLQDFIDGALDSTEDDDGLETSDNLNEPKEGELPFPKEMDDRVAQLKLNDNQEKHKCMDDIASVELKLMSDAANYSDAAMRVILKGKPGASLRPHRFSCYFYTADYYPVCEGEQVEKIRNGRRRELILNIPCDWIWIPGKYILMIGWSVSHAYRLLPRRTTGSYLGISEKPWTYLVRKYACFLSPMRQRELDLRVAHTWCFPNETSCYP